MFNKSAGWWPVVALSFAMLIWSSAFIALKTLLEVMQPGQVICLRMLIASVCFLALFKYWRGFTYQAGDWRWWLLMALMEPCLCFIFEMHALQYTSAGQAGMVTATLPLLVTGVAFFWLHERVTSGQTLGFMLAILGVVLLTFTGEQQADAPAPWLGNLLEFIAMGFAAVYSVILKKLSQHYGALFLTAIQAFIGLLFFAPLAWFEPAPVQFGARELLYCLYLGVGVTLGAYLLYNWAIQQIPVTLASAYTNLIPVFTVMLAYLLLGETMNLPQLLACGLVLVGVVWSQRTAKFPPAEPIPEV